MPITLIDLPYARDALAPTISADTLDLHHGKHHKAYVDKANAAIAGTPLADAKLEDIIKAAEDKGDKGLFNNAAQAWNHGFYWNSLTPDQGECPSDLAKAIEAAFGDEKALVKQLVERGVSHFASGWVWLAADSAGKLSIEETHDAGTLATGDKRPLLTIDVWEHAYYLDYQNRRPDHLADVTGKILNWAFAAANLDASETWRYPG
ncbi:MAG: superoxide dismutase [Novosphingobium sp.]